MSGDIFADLLKGTGSGAGAANTNDSNLSLKQRMDATTGTTGTQKGGLDLDFLDTYVSKKPMSDTTSSDLDDLLFGAPKRAASGASSSVNVNGNVQHNGVGNGKTSTDLLDDFFGQPVPKPSAAVPAPSDTPASKPASRSASTSASTSTQASRPVPQATASVSSLELRDGALAELMDMGFPLAKANAALDSTATGHDLDGAISFLMNQAHSQTSSRQQQQQRRSTSNGSSTRPNRWDSSLQEPPRGGEDFGSIVNDLSSEFMSTASFLFNTGKKKIQEGVDMYRQQRLENNDGQPLWMKNQSRYKVNSMKVPSFTDEDEQEMDPETMRQLIQQQRLREQRLKQEKQRENDLFSTPTSPSPSSSSPSLSSSSRDERRPHVAKPTKHDDDSSFEMYKSSSRHRSSRGNTTKAASAVKTAPEIPSLIETSTTPSTPQTTAAAKFSVPPLNSAQTMSFTTSREIGQEKFKAGDYPASLENFLAASNVIPADHPYQIILNSNLAVVYSKLGNPKEQLAVSTSGLELLFKSTNDASISDLSSICIEDNKNLKTFWVKLMTKRAESLEFLEKWTDAKEAYENLIKEGESSKAVMDGKNRCVKILNPKPQAPSQPRTRKQTGESTGVNRTAKPAPPKNNENLKHVQETNMKKEREDEEKFNLHDKVESQLDTWRAGNKNNIRALICSLDNVLWPELNWQPVKLTDLVLDKKVKIYYMKAVAKTHPDKISSTESVKNKMIANGVFITLNEAWETFKEGKSM